MDVSRWDTTETNRNRPSPSSHSMINTIQEGVAHGKLGGDGMAGRATSADSLERAPGKPGERYLQRVD